MHGCAQLKRVDALRRMWACMLRGADQPKVGILHSGWRVVARIGECRSRSQGAKVHAEASPEAGLGAPPVPEPDELLIWLDPDGPI